jgi:hypothetical protein
MTSSSHLNSPNSLIAPDGKYIIPTLQESLYTGRIEMLACAFANIGSRL